MKSPAKAAVVGDRLDEFRYTVFLENTGMKKARLSTKIYAGYGMVLAGEEC
ncbi:MAG: hypothetical protein ACYS7M_15700 [Planctomycetota bacterium]|jgi:hypothetical protein